MTRLAVVATHPIQYYAPLFRQLTERAGIEIRVFYEWEGASTVPTLDRDFGQAVQWDVPLLEGYAHEFVPNQAADPGTHHFDGLNNPDLVPRVLSFAPDAVLVFGWNYRSHLRLLRLLHSRVPILFRGDSTLLDERLGPRRLARRLFLRWIYRHIDRALYVGQHNRDYFRAHGLRDERLAWAPHAVDNARFADPAHDADALVWRRTLGIPDGAPTVVFAGKLEPKKAPDVLLDAFGRLGQTDTHLVVAGSGPMEAALRERAAGNARVHFVGFQNQSRMPVVYRLGDALVLPSRGPGETWGLAVNEAFACGRAAIVSDRVGCAPDLVLDGETGFVVPAANVTALTEALRLVAADRDHRMGAAARRHIVGWSMERLAESVEAAVCASSR